MKEFKDRLLADKERFISNIVSIAVVGAGISGIASAELAKHLGKRVKLTDLNKNLSSKTIKKLKTLGVETQLGGHSRNFFKDVDLVVISPG